MIGVKHSMARQIMAAALCLLPVFASANASIEYEPVTGVVVISGLTSDETELLQNEPSLLRLQTKASPAAQGMLVSVAEHESRVSVVPRFPLRQGATYDISIQWPDRPEISYEFTLEQETTARPTVVSFSPSQSVIPANTLRFYVTFSQPMARGQVREHITLMTVTGAEVPSPFLNLETELWDKSQTRLTLILDPGRVKQGVGPNKTAGAPLVAGDLYALEISGEMQSAKGQDLGQDQRITFAVGAPERRKINPLDWTVETPEAGTLAPLYIGFDRIMDNQAVVRLIQLQDASGTPIVGMEKSDGGGWSFFPATPWSATHYRLSVDPQLEDVAGNTTRAPFDAKSGTIGAEGSVATLDIEIQ